jgi:hypothetical protein
MSKNLTQAINANPRTNVAPRDGWLPCALPGCDGTYDPRRAVVRFADGELAAVCGAVDVHTRLARASKSTAATLSFFIRSYRVHNADRPIGASLDDSPIVPAEYDAKGRLIREPVATA